MTKVCVIQSDNRISLDYLLKSQAVTKMFCSYLDYQYEFIEIKDNEHIHLHPATKKIHVVRDFIQSDMYDILVFLDSDAWIQNGNWLNDIIQHLMKDSDKHGCFSRDPYLKINTFINSGSFILKINNYTRNMYEDIIMDLKKDAKYHSIWPYDQHYISDYVFRHKDDFMIFAPDIMNTPIGKVLRHNWLKNEKMYEDLNELFTLQKKDMDTSPFQIKQNYDCMTFPNTEDGFEYKEEMNVQESFQNQMGYAYTNQKDNYIIRFLHFISSYAVIIILLALCLISILYYNSMHKVKPKRLSRYNKI